MALDKSNINYRHPEYEERYTNWVFLKDSYDGGLSYKEKDYLTRYVNEEDSEYRSRVRQTPIDNHCKSIVSIYNSFLYKKPPSRDFGTYANDPMIQSFINDADREGRSLDDFMSQVNIVSSIYGHAWVIVDKPEVAVSTRAQEIENDIRPYLTLFSPLQILDWDYKQNMNGSYYLASLKVWEYGDDDSYCIKIFKPDTIERHFVEKQELVRTETYPNNIGIIPAVCVYSSRSDERGIGISDISDIADVQRSIFDANSELEQIVRLSNHPSLVMTNGTRPSAGAGAIITIEEGMDPGLKPYLLQPASQSIDSVRNLIKDRVETINRMANVGAVRQQESKKISGIALQQEFELLNARLAEKANNLELGEYQIWDLYSYWMGLPTGFCVIEYADSYNTKDKQSDFALLKEAKDLAVESPTLYKHIYLHMASLFVEDSKMLEQIAKEIAASQLKKAADEAEDEMEDEMEDEDEMESHIMMNPETGETREVSSEAEHTTLMNQGWIHPEDMNDD